MEPTSMRPVPASQSVIKSYLIAYNAVQTIGWTVFLLKFCNFYIYSDQENNSLYQNIKWPLLIFQSAAVLEVVHAVMGIVPSNARIASMQVGIRIALACGIIPNVVNAQNCLGFSIAMLAWAITEIVRYGYYTLHLAGIVPYFLMWLRYSTFIVLYPVRSLAELHCWQEAHKKLAETGIWDSTPSNFVLVTLLLTPFFIRLYNHMLVQRRKALQATDEFKVTQKKK